MRKNLLNQRISVEQFLELFLSLVQSGFSIPSALNVLCDESYTREYAIKIRGKIKSDETFSSSLCSISKQLDGYKTILATAEETGDIVPSLRNIIDELHEKNEEKKNIITFSLYPAFIVLFAFILSILLVIYGIPYINLIAAVETMQLIKGIVAANIWLICSLAVLYFFVRYISRKYDFQYAFFRNLYYLSLNGIGIEEALLVIIKESHFNNNDCRTISVILNGIRNGQRIGEVCKKLKSFDVFTTAWLSVAEDNGQVNEAFKKIFEKYGIKRKQNREMSQRFLEPGILVLCGVYIIILIATCIIPVFMSLGTKII